MPAMCVPPTAAHAAALCRFLDDQEMQAWGCGDEATEQPQQPQQQRSLSSQRRDFERMQSLVPLYIAGAAIIPAVLYC